MGQMLQKLRKSFGKSQADLARESGVPIGTIQGWEQDRREPLLGTAARVARALGVSIDALVEDEQRKSRKE